MDPKNHSHTFNLKEVIAKEEKHIKERRNNYDVSQEDGLTGLCISGGGIRSATLGLGFIQTIIGKNLMKKVDYLSTVSGGGYIGSCMSSILSNVGKSRHRNKKANHKADPENSDIYELEIPKEDYGVESKNSAFNELGIYDKAGKLDLEYKSAKETKIDVRHQLHHLRMHGEYLRIGSSVRDNFRLIGTFFSGLIFNVMLAFFLLVGLLALHDVAISFLSDNSFSQHIEQSVIHTAEKSVFMSYVDAIKNILKRHVYRGVMDHKITSLYAAIFGVFTGIAIWIAGIFYLSKQNNNKNSVAKKSGLNLKDLLEERFIQISFVVMLCAGPAAAILLVYLSPHLETPTEDYWLLLGLPFILNVGVFLVMMILSFFDRAGNKDLTSLSVTRQRSLKTGMIGASIFSTILAILIPIMILFIFMPSNAVEKTSIPRSILSLIASLTTGLGMFGVLKFFTNTESAIKYQDYLYKASGLITIIALFAIVAMVGGTFTNIKLQFLHSNQFNYSLIILGVSLVVLTIMTLYGNVNRISLHYYYRDRLAEAYLKTDARVENVPDSRGFPLSTIRDNRYLKIKDLDPHNRGPYHIIQGAVNLHSSKDLVRKSLQSDHFIFSKEFIGSKTTGWIETREYNRGKFKLAKAMTISAAAVGSGMGYYNSFTQSFLTTLFNFRTGYWLPNPFNYDSKKSYMRPGAFLLIKESLSWFNADNKLINVSDGGHTGDNLGLLPLLRRRCEKIIVCDFENDEKYTFEALNHAVRMAYIEESIEIEIDLEAISPQPSDKFPVSPESIVIGKITYPGVHRDDEGKEGMIYYVKSSLSAKGKSIDPKAVSKSLPLNAYTYKLKNETFPHESTSDQFFDDDQFEAYRSLGGHLGGLLVDKMPK